MNHEPRTTNHEPRITITVENDKSHLVEPNFILNRFDLWANGGSFETFHINSGSDDYYVQALYQGDTAELGLWRSSIPGREIMSLARHILRFRRDINRVRIRAACTRLPFSRKYFYTRLELPPTLEELRGRMSRKFRYNLKRERKILEEAEGSLLFEEYHAGNFPADLFAQFAGMKQEIYAGKYIPSGRAYFDDRRIISDVYVMRSGRTGDIISMVLSCEQCPIAYINNLTYDMKYSAYSPGRMIYHYYIEALTKKGRRDLFLGVGTNEYKLRYGGIRSEVYGFFVYRSFLKQLWYNLKGATLNYLPQKAVTALRKIIKPLKSRAVIHAK